MDIEMFYREENDNETFSVTSNLGQNWNKLPNEIWLIILSYLDVENKFESFSELNQRFNDLVYDSKYITLPTIMHHWWMRQYLPRLTQNVRKISLRLSDLSDVFTDEWSFKHLQTINIKRSYNLITRLRIGTTPIRDIIAAYEFLIEYTEDASRRWYKLTRENNISQDEINEINQSIDNFKSLSFSFIERLSLFVCSDEDLSIIINNAPNLIYLQLQTIKINFYNDVTDEDPNLNIKTANLRTLKMTKGGLVPNYFLEQLIKCSEKSLQNISLNIEFEYPIDGDFLEKIFKPCEHLKKLDLLLLFEDMYDDVDECLESFQSEWWLDQNRPIILLQLRDSSKIEIVSLPNRWEDFTFENDPTHWHFNKANFDSPLVRFNNIKNISINNKTNQPITLDCLQILDKILSSSEQYLNTNQCDLATVDILFELLINDTSMTQVLSKVKYFFMKAHERFEPKTLCVWILLMPNLEQLTILYPPDFEYSEFAKQLKAIVEQNQRLTSYFDRIKNLVILREGEGDRIKEESIQELLDVFQNASILC